MIFKLSKFPHTPNFNFKNLKKVKSIPIKVIALLVAYKMLIIVLIFLSLAAGALIVSRNHFIAQIKTTKDSNFSPPILSYSPAPDVSIAVASESAASPDTEVLGISTEKTTYTPIYKPTAIPTPTYKPVPIPTSTSTPVVSSSLTTPVSTPTSSSSNSSGHTCASMGVSPGVATAWYSQTSTPQIVGSNTATITIELRDCNDTIAQVSDTLTITQTSGPKTTVNGSSPPISIEATNGKAFFTIKSQTSGTAVYTVRDTSKSFNVTDPNNKPPEVTFNISAAASTPTPSPSSSSTPTVTPTPSSTPSPKPISSSTPVPSSTSIPTPLASPK